MIQITSTGNNFGGNAITFKTYQNGNFLILNGRLPIQTDTPQLAAAEHLEIYVPALSLKRSVETSLYVIFSYYGSRVVTIARSWIKNSTTICIEKMACFSDCDEIELVFCCLYTTKGKSKTVVPATRIPVEISDFGEQSELAFQQCVETSEWFHLCIKATGLANVDLTEDFGFNLSGVADSLEYDFLFICCSQDYRKHGNYFSESHFSDGRVSCQGVAGLTDKWSKTYILYGFFVK